MSISNIAFMNEKGDVNEKNEWKCAKCDSNQFQKRHVLLSGNKSVLLGIRDSDMATAYTCNKCDYMELYVGLR